MKATIPILVLSLVLAGCSGCDKAPARMPPPAPAKAPAANADNGPVERAATTGALPADKATFDRMAGYITEAMKRVPEGAASPVAHYEPVTEDMLRRMGLTEEQIRECSLLISVGEATLRGNRLAISVPARGNQGGWAVSIRLGFTVPDPAD